MFTGVSRELGAIKFLGKAGPVYRIDVASKEISRGVKIGDSVAVNGVCLTVTGFGTGVVSFDVMEETLRRTNLAGLKPNDCVNLESSLKAGDPIDGHFVLGHVDCLGKISDIKKMGGDFSITVDIPEGFLDLIVEKGSVAIDGISLTVGKVQGKKFIVYLIPHTAKVTTLGTKYTGDTVNIEFDIIGKYVLRSKELNAKPKITESFLKDNGF